MINLLIFVHGNRNDFLRYERQSIHHMSDINWNASRGAFFQVAGAGVAEREIMTPDFLAVSYLSYADESLSFWVAIAIIVTNRQRLGPQKAPGVTIVLSIFNHEKRH